MSTSSSSPGGSSSSSPRPFLCCIIDKSDVTIELQTLQRRLGSIDKIKVSACDVKTQAQALAHPMLPFADAIMVWHTVNIDEEMIKRMPRAKVIVRVGVGYDNVDLIACGKYGLPVCNVPNYGTEEVADHAMSLILALYRRTFFSAQKAENGEIAHGSDGVANLAKGTRRIRGSTLGILGCGRIGTATALRAKAFGFDVVFYDPYVPTGLDKALGIKRVMTADALSKCSDCVSIHCDLNETSRNLVDAKFIHSMKKGSYIVNTARGGIIDEKALRVYLENGHIAGAGIDVHVLEPYIGNPTEQPLAGAPNCICTPHTAFYSDEAYIEMRSLAAESIADALMGIGLMNVVNYEHLITAEGTNGIKARALVAAKRR
jgi:C-terminal binding protein